MRVERRNGRLVIHYAYLSYRHILFLLFSLPMLLFPIFGEDVPPILYSFMVIGLAVLYWSLSGILNRYTIELDASMLKIRTSPFPVFRDLDVPIAEVTRIYLHEEARSQSGFFTLNPVPTYFLEVVTASGKTYRITPKFKRVKECLYMERAIQGFRQP